MALEADANKEKTQALAAHFRASLMTRTDINDITDFGRPDVIFPVTGDRVKDFKVKKDGVMYHVSVSAIAGE